MIGSRHCFPNKCCHLSRSNASASYGLLFLPLNQKNPDSLKLYSENRLTITRQVKYDKAGNKPDLMLSVNGLPVVTVELKNPNSGQTVGIPEAFGH